MNAYLVVKWIHVVSSVLLVGTGFGSAFYMFFANRSASLETQRHVSRLVVRADWWFTSPAAVVQPVTGFWLAHEAGWSLTTPWLLLALVLFALAGACWLPVVWLQLRMAALAEQAHAQGHAMPAQYHAYARAWERLGAPAFAAMLVVYFLMVAKPALWA